MLEAFEMFMSEHTLRRLHSLMEDLQAFLANQKHHQEDEPLSPESKQEEDVQLSSRSPPPVAHGSHQSMTPVKPRPSATHQKKTRSARPQ